MTTQYMKLVPAIEPDSKEFWEGCKRHELLILKCQKCGALRTFPWVGCPNCGSLDSEWVKASGKGKIYSYGIVYRTFHPAYEPPYNIVMVELEEQKESPLPVRMNGNVVDVKPEELHIGMPVEVIFEDLTPEIDLPNWKPVS